MQKLDMEVTDERFNYMKNLLVMLYADQIGMEVKSIKVTPVNTKRNSDIKELVRVKAKT